MARRKQRAKDNDFLLLTLPFLAVGILTFVFFSQRAKIQLPNSLADIPNTPLIVENKMSAADIEAAKKIQGMRDDFAVLSTKIKQESGVYGLYIKDENRKIDFKYNESGEFYAASLYKLPIAAAALKAIEKGKLTKDTKITYLPYDYSSGTGEINTYNYGIELRTEDVLTELLKNSDNTAQSMILRQLDFNYVEDTFSALVPDPKTSTYFRYNTSTAYEVGYVVDQLYFGKYLNSDSKVFLKDTLIGTSFEDRISAYLKPGLKFSHKIGSWPETWHDCGVVYGKYDQVVVCLMSTSAPYENFLNVSKQVGEFISKYYE